MDKTQNRASVGGVHCHVCVCLALLNVFNSIANLPVFYLFGQVKSGGEAGNALFSLVHLPSIFVLLESKARARRANMINSLHAAVLFCES